MHIFQDSIYFLRFKVFSRSKLPKADQLDKSEVIVLTIQGYEQLKKWDVSSKYQLDKDQVVTQE